MKRWQLIDTFENLQRYFCTESSCVPFLFQLKWPQGFVCPRCHHPHAYAIRTRRLPLYECRSCRHQTSLTAGTVMEGSRTSLRKWITAFWLVSRSDTGINAVKLSSIVKVTYKTAWSMLHKIRAAISQTDASQPLEGEIRGIVAFHGHLDPSTADLHPRETPLIIAESVTPDGQLFNVKMKLVKREYVSHKLLLRSACDCFNAQHVSPNASEMSIVRQRFRVDRHGRLYSAFNQARSWMSTTFHGIGAKYLQRYLDEFCFRYNSDTALASTWDKLISLCMSSTFSIQRYTSDCAARHNSCITAIRHN
ncbi:transposase [Paenibacillus apiarius]|uniref:Transposase n=1 Tax=Paenibacillus apiarius TaxID=46240 RepID=A0ABT4DXA5_9BACL|nr:transposase [Paenibacillus apiarius]MCY9515676.1 transposase [Paenibacillus apiarius]MCY9521991.1 transposase [Paenibacillus apiarius]MCY9550537.1 transposase [Paenibacillus apiarius]MCY9559814.1 transposase [Paenibacillus apiarius]MCY9683502.1 transposase [Paenibacillus apiarius]